MDKNMEEIIKFYNDEEFDGKLLIEYFNEHQNDFMFTQGFPSELNDVIYNYYFPRNLKKMDTLIKIVNNNDITNEYKKVLIGKNLFYHNFDTTGYKSAVEYLFSNMFFHKKHNIKELSIIDAVNFYRGNHSEDDVNKLINYIKSNDFRQLDSKIIGIVGKPYKSIETITKNFEQVFKSGYTLKEYNGEDINTIVGRYGELLIYNELLKDQDKYTIWVSKDVGDGYGYDFMTVDKIDGKTRLIEVKTTYTDNFDKYLTYKEGLQYYSPQCSDRYEYEFDVVALPKNGDVIIYNYEYNRGNDNLIVSSNIDSEFYTSKPFYGIRNGKERLIIPFPKEMFDNYKNRFNITPKINIKK